VWVDTETLRAVWRAHTEQIWWKLKEYKEVKRRDEQEKGNWRLEESGEDEIRKEWWREEMPVDRTREVERIYVEKRGEVEKRKEKRRETMMLWEEKVRREMKYDAKRRRWDAVTEEEMKTESVFNMS
jgi:hypothetical protein